MNLGKLEKINDLRTVWKNEEYDFTKWLANEENIAMLGEELGITIVVTNTEAKTGRYECDILGYEEETGKKIIIENQLEITNHDHLGKLIVYGAGQDAKYQIWMVKDYRAEHKQAVDWLNEHADDNINIFLVKIELWKIGDSQVAPKFQIISSPNNWTKMVRTNQAKKPDETSESKKIQLNFWEDFKNYCESNSAPFNVRNPQPQHWSDIAIGVSGCCLSLTYSPKNGEITCGLWISDDKELFNYLNENKSAINNKISSDLVWHNPQNKKASNIRLKCKDRITDDNWGFAFNWLKENIELFKDVFVEYIRR